MAVNDLCYGPAMTTPPKPIESTQLDRPVFFVSLFLLLGVTGLLLLDPEQSLAQLQVMHRFMTHDLGWLFLGFVFVGLIWLTWLAMSRHGDIVLGDPEKPPAYSAISWFGMLFCAGIGSNLLYFGTTEWTGYFLKPPPISGAAAGSPEAADWAGAYSFFHWGISAWATYAIATIPIAYMLHVRRSSTLRVSTACEGVLGKRAQGPVGQLIDILFIFGLVGGVATSLGIGIPMISAVASDLSGVERGMGLDAAILVGLTVMFSLSVGAGLDKGIKRLSDINVVLAIVLLGFIMAVGPSSFIINQAFDSLALMFQNFIEMSLRTDAGNNVSFAQENTIFFWAWWMAWAPFMGLFVARISGGRTIREVIVGVVVGGSLACWAGFAILGHSTMALSKEGHAGFSALLDRARAGEGFDGPQAVVELLGALPLSVPISVVFFVLAFIFVATSLDSAALALSAAASKNLPVEGEPPRWHRLLWAFVLGGTALSLMYLGGLQVLQAASVVVGLPLVAVMGLMVVSLMRHLADAESS
jgi:BCCT family betaine/carnitine transporter